MYKWAFILALTAALMPPTPAHAAAECVARFLPAATPVGAGQGRRLVFHAYDATLYAPHGTYQENKPFALTLKYHMRFSGRDIVAESVRQIRRQATASAQQLQEWQKQMSAIIPDVEPGMSLTGLRLKNGHTVFCAGGQEIGRIKDPDFTQAFFGIWLNKNTETPTLRQQLTGLQ